MSEPPPLDSHATVEDVGSILHEYIKGEYKLSMWIPEELAGRVVGKQGIVITNLQRETHATIKALARVGESLWVAIVIMGEWKHIVKAYKAVSDIVHGEVDDVVLEFMINYRQPFFLYGKNKNLAIRTISAKSNVRIYFPEFDVKKQNFREAEHFTLEGSFENVQRSVELLEEEAREYRKVQKERKRESPAVESSDSVHLLARAAKDSDRSKEKENPSRVELPDSKEKPVTREGKSEPVGKQDNREKGKEKPRESDTSNKVARAPITSGDNSLERLIEIPSNLVGLLLSKQNSAKISIMNQIQHGTHTIISKITTASSSTAKATAQTVPPSEEKGPIRRRKAREEASQSGSESGSEEDDGSQEDSASEEEEEEEEHVGEVGRIEAVEQKVEGDVVFRIFGQDATCVNAAHELLSRIVVGDRIPLVMKSLKEISASLPIVESRRGGGGRPPKAQDSRNGSAGEQRPSSGRGRERRKRDGPPAEPHAAALISGTNEVQNAVPSSKGERESGKGPRDGDNATTTSEGQWQRNVKPPRREKVESGGSKATNKEEHKTSEPKGRDHGRDSRKPGKEKEKEKEGGSSRQRGPPSGNEGRKAPRDGSQKVNSAATAEKSKTSG